MPWMLSTWLFLSRSPAYTFWVAANIAVHFALIHVISFNEPWLRFGVLLGWGRFWVGGLRGAINVLVFAFRKLRFCSFMYLRRRSWHYALATSCNAEDALDAMVSQRSSPLTAQVDTLQAIELQRHPGLDITPWCVPRCCEAAEQAKLPMLQRTFSTCQRTSHGCMILNYKADGIWKEIEHCVKSMSHYFQIIPLKYYMFLPLITASSISKHPLKKELMTQLLSPFALLLNGLPQIINTWGSLFNF